MTLHLNHFKYFSQNYCTCRLLFFFHRDITESTDGPVAERKYIVFESCLQILLSICRFCSQPCSVVLKQMCGSGATFECSCPKGHLFKWQSQPVHCKMPLGNLVVSSGILFTGSSPKAVINLFEQCNIACMTDRTYRNIQSCYLIPAVHNVWEGNNTVELQMCREGNVKVGGDARFCSPGHTAKYASYSLMNMETGVILATELVQVQLDLFETIFLFTIYLSVCYLYPCRF